MAKKTVADFRTETGKDYIKVITMKKGEKGAYKFIEKIVKREDVDKHLKNG